MKSDQAQPGARAGPMRRAHQSVRPFHNGRSRQPPLRSPAGRILSHPAPRPFGHSAAFSFSLLPLSFSLSLPNPELPSPNPELPSPNPELSAPKAGISAPTPASALPSMDALNTFIPSKICDADLHPRLDRVWILDDFCSPGMRSRAKRGKAHLAQLMETFLSPPNARPSLQICNSRERFRSCWSGLFLQNV